jgi:hypothetical protein
MAYSLLNRFRGTFVGVAIAENQMGFVDGSDRNSQIMKASAYSLIRSGGLNLRDWQSHCIPHESGATSLQAGLLALLPIILFYHEDEYWLFQQLKQAIDHWPELDSHASDIMVFGWAIAHGITKKNDSESIIYSIQKRLENAENAENIYDFIGENLPKINRLFAASASWETALSQLKMDNHPDSAAIYLALYCFLSTPEHFQLSIQRAARSQTQPLLTTLLTAALSGAYNSHAGIPMTWQLTESNQTPLQSRIIEQMTVADRLYATWLGIYHVVENMEKSRFQPQMVVVTDPHLLVPRSD